MGKLDGKAALVTGAGGGLGRAHALLLAREGASVVVNDLGGARDGTGAGSSMADAVAAEIAAAGGQAVADHGSVTDREAVRRMVRTCVERFGKLDICINNAGILRDKTFKNMSDELWNPVVEVHLQGAYLVSKAAWDQMLTQGQGGRIVNTSSTSGLIGNFGQSNYAAAKAGIAGLTRVLALEGAKYGITANTLVPTAWSRMTHDILPEGVEQRFAPEKVSPIVVWLCTDEAKNVTGRQFCAGSNRVSLLSWQVTEIAEKDPMDAPWSLDELGEQVAATLDSWPKPMKPTDV